LRLASPNSKWYSNFLAMGAALLFPSGIRTSHMPNGVTVAAAWGQIVFVPNPVLYYERLYVGTLVRL
jgi:hypothetical protein